MLGIWCEEEKDKMSNTSQEEKSARIPIFTSHKEESCFGEGFQIILKQIRE